MNGRKIRSQRELSNFIISTFNEEIPANLGLFAFPLSLQICQREHSMQLFAIKRVNSNSIFHVLLTSQLRMWMGKRRGAKKWKKDGINEKFHQETRKEFLCGKEKKRQNTEEEGEGKELKMRRGWNIYLKSEHQFIASLKVNSLSNTLTADGVRKGARKNWEWIKNQVNSRTSPTSISNWLIWRNLDAFPLRFFSFFFHFTTYMKAILERRVVRVSIIMLLPSRNILNYKLYYIYRHWKVQFSHEKVLCCESLFRD